MPVLPIAQTGGVLPGFEQLINRLWPFFTKGIRRWWWLLLIVGIVWYMRWYRAVLDRGSRNPTIQAWSATVLHGIKLTIDSWVTVASFILFALGGILWLGQAFPALTAGLVAIDPTSIAALAGILASLAAGLGLFENVDSIFVVFVIVAFTWIALTIARGRIRSLTDSPPD